MSKKKDSSVKKDLPDSKDSSVKTDKPNSKDSSVKKDRPNSSHVYFYDEIPRIAACRSCTVLVPVPNICYNNREIVKIKRSEQTFQSFGYCTILLLKYDSNEDVVNLTARENQTAKISINLNQIIDKSLVHIVKDSKVWQEFHLNDLGRKRSVVLQFERGQEFDDFFRKLSGVLSLLHVCQYGKLSVDKKYYLVGFKDDPKELITEISPRPYFDSENGQHCSSDGRAEDPKEVITDSEKSYSSDSSENSTNEPIDSSFVIAPPFSPRDFNNLQTTRVTGLDEKLTAWLHKKPESEKNKRDRHHKLIYGSHLKPPSVISLRETLEHELLKEEGNATIKSSNTEQSYINRRKNLSGDDNKHSNDGTVKHRDFCQSVNITEIDSTYDYCQTVDITQLDFDYIKLKRETCDQTQIKHSDDSDLIHSETTN